MKTLIIYFSQTGFTRKVAEQIRDGVAEVGGHCDFKTLGDVKPESLADYDLVGLGCPVFYYNAPFNVRDFMQGLPELADKQWFVFCTHGSVMGNTLILMAEALKAKGIRVVGYHDTYADGTIPFYPYPTLTTGHPDEREYEEARAFGREIAERSRRIAAGEKGLIPEAGEKNPEWAQQADTFSLEFLSQVMPRMSINEEKCVQCQECVENCPVDGIDPESDPPRIQDPCIYCFNCAKICPELAIEADWDVVVSIAPQNYARYREVLEEAAARGEFRWLMDPDSLDLDDPLYKQREREIKGK
jgi:flavodoxin/NAD-dependent dihydropyrimidine dehydrogenase PreA subunit